jgi:NADH:ubiquinone oxidoreductase subunit
MLTLFKKIFTWWNQDTFGTRLKTIFFGKLAGTDQFGNKYYEDKKGKRWVIYSDVIDASKIPVEWYSWMHFTPNKIEKKHELENWFRRIRRSFSCVPRLDSRPRKKEPKIINADESYALAA